MELLDGKLVSKNLFSRLELRVRTLKQRGIEPHLIIFLIGHNSASETYVSMKQKASKKIGIISEVLRYENNVSQDEILDRIRTLNADPNAHGMMVQLPIPDSLSLPIIMSAIDPKKDADGFHAYNFGKMALSKDFEHLPPATALGIIRLLEAYNIDVSGMNVTVLGKSNLVGKPIALMLMNRGATVTVCNSKTKNTEAHCRSADMIITATGVPKLVKGDWIKEGAIVVDAGFSHVDGEVTGDVDFEGVAPRCSMITPVPGGIGPMTIYSIVENTITAVERQLSITK